MTRPGQGTAEELADDSFLIGMSPDLAGVYRRWYPFCRESVLGVVDRIGSRAFLGEALGTPLSDQQYAMLRQAWLEPFRAYHTRSGKMLRPVLVCLCVTACGGDPATMPTMVALPELIHSTTLVLDDIADDSPLRRGGPTAHRMVGIRVASVMACAWLNSCFELLTITDPGIAPAAGELLVATLAWEHWVSGVGQTIDTTWPWLGKFDRTAEQYMQAVVHRSTSSSFRLPFTIGAIAAGVTAEQRDQLSAFGEELGLAFQIIDDILDIRGDAKWGKQLAEDLTQGKLTLQVMVALRRATQRDQARLKEILAGHVTDPAELAEAVAIMDRTGAFDAASEMAATHTARARAIVDRMEFLSAEYRAILHGFVDYAVTRTR